MLQWIPIDAQKSFKYAYLTRYQEIVPKIIILVDKITINSDNSE